MDGMTELQTALIGAAPHILVIVALLVAGLSALVVVFIVGAMLCVGGGRGEADATAGGMPDDAFRPGPVLPLPRVEPFS